MMTTTTERGRGFSPGLFFVRKNEKWGESGERMDRGQKTRKALRVTETMQGLVFIWCRRSESNRHFRKERGILSPLRLPVSPLRHVRQISIGER